MRYVRRELPNSRSIAIDEILHCLLRDAASCRITLLLDKVRVYLLKFERLLFCIVFLLYVLPAGTAHFFP